MPAQDDRKKTNDRVTESLAHSALARRYVQAIRQSYPDLAVRDAQLNYEGQFSHILVVNGEIVFRFPRYAEGVEGLAHEARILRHLQARVTLPIPAPIYASRGTQAVGQAFMGYRLIPGEPLWPRTLAAIDDEEVLQRLAGQLALFLKELHGLPLEEFGADPPADDGRDWYAAMYAEIRAELFPHMRPDARAGVRRHFEAYLSNPRLHDYQPAPHHGDLGGCNILYDPQRRAISGIIDFSSAGVGDPAQDIAAVSWYGEPFLRRLQATYPQIEAMRERARFYRGTYALEEALHGLRSGDRRALERGMAEYV